ncbi:murein biosynthesis integral membrane protein MurJ [Corynebacterium hesseae]|uniref:murein biosynthesis integral membrane protein MurJ n=1 Tax=Corynebacterium hesseae TaxID=2913502 RepID=UPI001EF37711|nr:murein biosynthesis integral membrane protein MurJ [Corynebacterium hesseae]MCG7261721.1 murein biosynthesis integral membrane protein MurJ [Corynebacterium aurimucosum]MCZ9298802.1 murein biosynthesis integral membrane protein MurJ [Corynebacterium hesseae]
MTHEPKSGARRRIVTPSPPAPVPEKRAPSGVVAVDDELEDRSGLKGKAAAASSEPSGEKNSDGAVVRATGSMAIATMISRITGFIRNVLIGSSLGPAISSAFTTANQLPNLITEIVLGAVLTSLVVPVLVRAEKEDADRGEDFVRRLFTLAFSLLATITVLSCIFAPQLTRMMLPEDGEVNAVQATSFAYLLLPQIFFYGLFALFQAVLNTKNIFGPGAWAPVVNNIISITVLVAYQLLPGSLHPDAPSPITDRHVLLLALGTTAGVVVQCLILFPYLKKAGINLKPLWGLDDRLKQFGGMAMAIVAYVAVSQLGYVITSRVAAHADKEAPFIYQQAWLLLQVPYGVIGVTLLTAIMPRLSRNAADGDVKAVVRDLTLGTKLTFIALIPIVIFMTGFGIPIARGLFQYGAFNAKAAEVLGLTLSFSAFTLIPYALVLLHLRVFYAREEAWTPTFIIAGITLTKSVLSLFAPHVADSPDRVVVLLGTANGFGFVAGAVIGGFLLKRKLGSLGGRAVIATTIWSVLASLVGLVVAFAINYVINLVLPEQVPPFVYLLKLAVAGLIFVAVTGIVLSRSGLPEVINLGRQLQRIPGMSRIIKIEHAEAIEVEAPEQLEIQPIFSVDAFNSSPVPPPMSAGIVRGPRLVPGAPVSDGRFRLLKDYGSAAGTRFWKAREQATGRLVSLTFVDTTGEAPMAPATPAVAARRSAEVSRATRRLAEMELDAMAENIDILSYRQGCLVVADWVEGTSLKTVSEDEDLDPRAVAHALVPLVRTTAAAHAAGLVLGIENRNRIRISTEGIATLAFPAVLHSNDEETDRSALASAISLLVESTSPTPEVLQEIAADAEEGQDSDLEDIANRLAAFAGDGDEGEETLQIPVEETPRKEDPSPAPGFGGRGYSGSGIIVLGALATLFVVAMAALSVWILSHVGNEKTSPVVTKSESTTETSFPNVPPVLLKDVKTTSVPEGKEVSGSWSTKKADTGLLLSIDKPTQLRALPLQQSKSTGAKYEVYGVNTKDFDPTDPDSGKLTELAHGTLTNARQDIELKEKPVAFDGALIVFTDMPKSGSVTLKEATLVGIPTN